MHSLVWHQIEHKLASSLVLFDVLGLLLLAPSGGTLLLAINEVPEAFGSQESLHLFAPGSIVVAIKRLNAMAL